MGEIWKRKSVMIFLVEAFDGVWIDLKEQVISRKKISQIRFSISKSLQNLRNGASHSIHQPRFPPQQLSQARDSQLLQPPPNRRSLSDSEPPPRSFPNPFSSSWSPKCLLKFLTVSQSPVPEFACGCGFEGRHGGFGSLLRRKQSIESAFIKEEKQSDRERLFRALNGLATGSWGFAFAAAAAAATKKKKKKIHMHLLYK